jgi:hypothetical protein
MPRKPRDKKIKRALIRMAVPETEYQMAQRKEREHKLDQHVKSVTSPEFHFQKTILHRELTPPADIKHHYKVDITHSENMEKPVEVKKAVIPKMREDPVQHKEEKMDAKPKSAKSVAHAENMRKVQKLRKEKGVTLAEAWAMVKK